MNAYLNHRREINGAFARGPVRSWLRYPGGDPTVSGGSSSS